ncbi:MAG: DUF6159 family protein, partial [Anaerolineales bacterium]|nr:DUF6159 family protein [Anaerolineales bacterium]
VLVTEDVGPIESIQRSAAYLKKTWGEQIAGNFSIGLVFGLFMFLVLLISVPLFIWAATAEAFVAMAIIGGIAVLLLALLSLVSNTLQGIYVAAIYHHIVLGQTGGYFSKEQIKGAFRNR